MWLLKWNFDMFLKPQILHSNALRSATEPSEQGANKNDKKYFLINERQYHDLGLEQKNGSLFGWNDGFGWNERYQLSCLLFFVVDV